ncbi:hypothetical protein PZA11_005223 [Diplocarpon coronariae]
MASTTDPRSTAAPGAPDSASFPESHLSSTGKTTQSVSPTSLAALNLSATSSSSASITPPVATSTPAATGTRKSSRATKMTSRGAEFEERKMLRVRSASVLKKVVKEKSVSPPKPNGKEKCDTGHISSPAEKKRYTLKFSPEIIRKMKDVDETSPATPPTGESSKSPATILPPKKSLASLPSRKKGTSPMSSAPILASTKPAKTEDTVRGVSKEDQSSTSAVSKLSSTLSVTESSKMTKKPGKTAPKQAAVSTKSNKVAAKPLGEVTNSLQTAKDTAKLATSSTAKFAKSPSEFAAIPPATKRFWREDDTRISAPTPASKRARAHARGIDDTQVIFSEPAIHRGRGKDDIQAIFQAPSIFGDGAEDDTQVTSEPSNTLYTVATISGVNRLPLKNPRMFTGFQSASPVPAEILTPEQEADRREFTTLYFAYGKEAGYTYFTQKFKANFAACYSTASLSGYKFTLHSDGYAKIHASAGDEVWGTLWLIPNATRRIIEAKAVKHGMEFVEVDGVQPLDRDPQAMPGNWYAAPVANEEPLTVWVGVAQELDGNEHLGKQAITANENKWQNLNAAIVYMYTEALSNSYVEKALRPWIPYPTTAYDSGYWTKKKAPKVVDKTSAKDAVKFSPRLSPKDT